MLPDSLQKHVTPKRKRQGLTLAAVAAVYSVLGFFGAPALIEKLMTDFVKDELKLDATVSKIEFNPWTLALKINDLTIKEPEADTLVSLESFYVNVDVLRSLWIRGAGLSELDLLTPYINVKLDSLGNLNLLQLVPASEEEETESGDVNWRIGKLGIHQGHIDFRDETRKTPFDASFKPLNIGLENLSSQPEKDGGYKLVAETGEGEKLSWSGTVALKPVRSQGHLEISDLKAATLWRYVQDDVPVIVNDGRISIGGEYDLLAGDEVNFKLSKGRFEIDELKITQKGANPLIFSLNNISLDDVALDYPTTQVTSAGLRFNQFTLLGQAEKPALFEFEHLGLNSLTWNAAQETAHIAEIKLDALALRDEASNALFTLPNLGLQKISATVPAQELSIGHIGLQDGVANVQVLNNGDINWLSAIDQLVKRAESLQMPSEDAALATNTTSTVAANASTETAPTKPWALKLGQFDLANFTVNAEDNRFSPSVKVPLQNIALTIIPKATETASHELSGSIDIGTGGNVKLNGNLTELPLKVDTNIALNALNLPPLAPYFADIARFDMESGTLSVNGKFNYVDAEKPQATFNGNVSIDKFSALDTQLKQRFMAWNALNASGIKWQMEPMRLSVREVKADRPFARLIIAPDYTMNIEHVFATADSNTQQAQAAPAQAASSSDMMPLSIDRVLVQNGSMLFADLTLRPQFATGIQKLNGDIRGISTQKNARAKILLNGAVDQYGKALIQGDVNVLESDKHSDLNVKFDNLELTTMTPYSAKFAGYRIDKGKLSLDLNYQIRDRKLDAKNKVVLNQLTLGEKVDSEDAMNLPLRLAVAILKDRHGVIDIDLPISGSMDDPEFKVGPIIWKTLLNLITKAATAPFSMLGSMVGGDEKMDTITFNPGQITLAETEREKLNKLAAALKERDGLRLEVRGTYDPKVDELAIKTRKFTQALQQRGSVDGKEQRVFESMLREVAGSDYVSKIKDSHLSSDLDKEAEAAALKGYVTALRADLINREAVIESDLRQLALARARVVRAQLIEQNQLDDTRVFVLEPAASTGSSELIEMKLGLNAG